MWEKSIFNSINIEPAMIQDTECRPLLVRYTREFVKYKSFH